MMRIVILAYELKQRRDDESHRSTNLMRDVDEETKLLLVKFLLMYMFLNDKAFAVAQALEVNISPEGSKEKQEIENP
jgi:hypothetical protein